MTKYLESIQPINTPSLNNECYKKIKEMILGGQLQWGERIGVGLLASSFGVSKFPVIKALDRLAQEQLLTISPNRGTFVTTPTQEDCLEVTEIRIMMEKHALKTAAAKDREGLVRTLKAIQDRSCFESIPIDQIDFKSFLNYDRQFHTAIIEYIDNKRISAYYASIRSQAELFRTRTFFKGNISNAIAKHKEIVSRLETNDTEGAITSLLEHLLQVNEDEKHTLEEKEQS